MLCGLKIDLIQPKENGSTSSVAMKRQTPIDKAYAYA